jgi:serine phosphatase RsbU (regulator of sigma subunit)/putative methionine-R-sulfoxide reductase with GAF domain
LVLPQLSLTNSLLLLLAVVPSLIASIAVLLYLRRRGSSRRELQNRVDETRTVSQAVLAIASAKLDEDELCKLVHEQVGRVVDASTFQIGLFEDKYYVPKLRFVRGVALPKEQFDLSEAGGLFGYIRESGRWLLVRDFEKELDMLPAKPRYISANPPCSAVFVPLVTVNGVIGGMAVQSDMVGAYTEPHARLLSIIANQAASAIQNARALANERERARQFELVSQVSSDTALILDLETLLVRLIEAIHSAFGYYFIGIFLIDDASHQVVCRASTSNVPLENMRMQSGAGLIGACIVSQQIITSANVDEDPRYLRDPVLPKTKSEAVVPLLVAGQPIGVLDLQSTALAAFKDSDARFLEILGQQVSVAIEDARLYEAEREQAWQNNALRQVAEISSHADDLDDAVTAVAEIVPKLGSVEMCAVLTTDEQAEQFVIAALDGQLSDHEDLNPGDTLMLDDVPALRTMREQGQPVMGTNSGRLNRPVLALPLLGQGKLLGALLVCHTDGESFSARRIEMLTGLANQAALVLDTVRAKVAQQDESWLTAALLQVAQAVNQSENLEQIAETIASLTPLLVGVDACAIFAREGHDTTMRALHGHGFGPNAQSAISTNDFPVAAWREWVLAKDADPLPNRLELEPVPPRVAEKLETKHLAVLPLIVKSQLVGALVVAARSQSQLPHDRTFRILMGIAQQTAVAVESARLQQEGMERQRLDQELSFARDIQTSFLPKEVPQAEGWSVAAAWQAARQVGGDFYDFMQMPDGSVGIAVADVADKGVPAALFMAMSRTLTRSVAFEGYPPAALLKRVNGIILADSRTDLFVTVFFAKWDPKSGKVEYANAGHNPPLIFRANLASAQKAFGSEAESRLSAGSELDSIQQLPNQGIALGVLKGVLLTDQMLMLEPGDVMLMYTDGITDALNAEGAEFGIEKLMEVLRTTAALSAQEIANAIMSAVSYFAGNEPPFDDQTLVVLKREMLS